MNNRAYYQRRTKIICTIGPATSKVSVIQRLIRAGMDVARLNFSYGSFEEHAGLIKKIRNASRRTGREVAILIDLPGPKYRIGRLRGGQVLLRRRSRVRLTAADVEGDSGLLPVNLPALATDIRRGDRVLLADGAMQLRVEEVKGDEVICRVVVGGLLLAGKGLVVPGMRSSLPFVTEQLRQALLFAIGQRPDYLALSFVTTGADIAAVKAIMAEHGADIPIISKIERGEAVRNFKSILDASDGIMVARGDLGVEISLEKVPLVQKDFIKECNRTGKPVITATEMLESMVNSLRPTRAEATDVTNAILDGTDAIMLSAETSVGKYPVPAVQTMAKIARAAEKGIQYDRILAERRDWLERETDELISYSACQTARSLRASAIVAFTQSGSTAMRVSKYRPSVPVLALTPGEDVSGRLVLYWGVRTYRIAASGTVDELFAAGARIARELGVAAPGSLIIITAGIPIGETGTTNMLKVERIGR